MTQFRKPQSCDGEDGEIPSLFGPKPNPLLDKYTPTIYLRGEVTSEMAKNFREAIQELEFIRKSDMVLIQIGSIGGSAYATLEILNAIAASSMEFITYCDSHAFSAGAIILSAGAQGSRFMAPLSQAMVHSLGTAAVGRMEELRNDMRSNEMLNGMIMDLVAKNCGKSRAELEAAIKENGAPDLYMSPTQAKEFGLVDVVAQVSLVQARAYQLEVTEVEEVKPEPKPAPAARKAVKRPSRPAKKAKS